MSRELDAILGMLSSADVELQCAAARVLGEIGSANEETVRKLGSLLADGPALARAYALQALGKFRRADALKHVIAALVEPEPLRTKARELLVAAGPDVISALTPYLDRKSPAMRMAVVETLGHMRSKEALDLLMECMKDEDYEVVKTATALVRTRIDAMTDKERREVFQRCAKLLGSAEAKKNRNAAVSAIRLLGHLREPEAVKHLLRFTGHKEPAQVRANALLSLGHVPIQPKDEATLAEALLPLLEDEDYANVVVHALAVLARIPAPKSAQKRLEKILESPHHAVRLYAERAIGTTGSKQSAALLLGLLDHPDPKQAEEAARALQNPAYSKAVLDAFGKFDGVARGWTLVQILKGQGVKLEGPARLSVSKKLLAAVDGGKEEVKVYFELLRLADPKRLVDLLLDKGRTLRKTKKPEAAAKYLALVNRDDLVTPEVTYELALARLDFMNLDISRPSSDPQSPVVQIAHLLRNPDFPLLKRLKAEKPAVRPDALLYLGYRFTERMGAEREFGGELLKLLAAKHAKSTEGKTAKQKLRTEGLE